MSSRCHLHDVEDVVPADHLRALRFWLDFIGDEASRGPYYISRKMLKSMSFSTGLLVAIIQTDH